MQRECFFSKCHDVFLSHVSMKCLRYHVWNGGGVRGIKSLRHLWSRWTCRDRYVVYEGFSFWKRRKPTTPADYYLLRINCIPVGIQDLGFLLFDARVCLSCWDSYFLVSTATIHHLSRAPARFLIQKIKSNHGCCSSTDGGGSNTIPQKLLLDAFSLLFNPTAL